MAQDHEWPIHGQFTVWVSVSNTLKSKPSCTSYKLWESFERWQVHRGLQHGIYSNSARYTYHLCMCLCNVNSISFLKNSFHVKSVQNFSKYFLKFENYFNDTTFLKYFTLKTKFYKYTIYTKCGYLAICCESWISFLFSFEYKE